MFTAASDAQTVCTSKLTTPDFSSLTSLLMMIPSVPQKSKEK
jgi:hypothetical protein